jgi:hypothetical protein
MSLVNFGSRGADLDAVKGEGLGAIKPAWCANLWAEMLAPAQWMEIGFKITTLIMVFGVVYYLELRNAMSIMCIPYVLSTNVKLVVWAL